MFQKLNASAVVHGQRIARKFFPVLYRLQLSFYFPKQLLEPALPKDTPATAGFRTPLS